jgi:hypothetical protein
MRPPSKYFASPLPSYATRQPWIDRKFWAIESAEPREPKEPPAATWPRARPWWDRLSRGRPRKAPQIARSSLPSREGVSG